MATMSEAQAYAYLTNWFGELFRTAERTADNTDTGFKPVVDEVWGFMGLTTGADVAPDREKTITLLDAFAYKMALMWLVNLYNGQTDAPTTRLETFQVYQGTVPLAAQAFRAAKRYGFGGDTVVMSDLRLDDVNAMNADADRMAARRSRMGRPWTEFG